MTIRRLFTATFCGIALSLASTGAMQAQTAAAQTTPAQTAPAQSGAPANLLANPTLQDADGDQVPDKWKSSAPPDAEKIKIQMDAQGGVQIVDQDKANGVGLAQYVAVQPGHKYKLSASFKGSGGLWLYLQFLDAIPAREGDISKHVLSESRQNTSPSDEFKEYSLPVTAPAPAKHARIWFYCPKIGVTDSVVRNPRLEDLGVVPGVDRAFPVSLSGMATTLANPDFKDADADNLPDAWRVFPEAAGTTTKVAMAATGGVQIVDVDKSKGIGLQQQLPAQAGVTYTLKATLKGATGLSLNLQFLSAKPARDSELRKHLIEDKQVFAGATPEGKTTSLTAKAPAGTQFLRVWLYSPSVGVTDVVIESVRLESGATAPGNDKLLFVGDFESGNLDGWEQQFPHSTPGQVVTTPVRAGKFAVRNELTYQDFKTYGDSRNRRSEIVTQNVGRPGAERWYGFSIYLPKDWEDEIFDIVMQVHSHPDPGEPAKSPLLTLETAGKEWRIYNRWDKEKISRPAQTGAGGTITTNRLWQGAYETEKWTDWVFHVKWSLEEDGLVEVWKDGQQIVAHKGPNCYNEERPFYLKLGVYKPAYRATAPPQRVIFHDEIRIGNDSASYADVAPPGAAPPGAAPPGAALPGSATKE